MKSYHFILNIYYIIAYIRLMVYELISKFQLLVNRHHNILKCFFNLRQSTEVYTLKYHQYFNINYVKQSY